VTHSTEINVLMRRNKETHLNYHTSPQGTTYSRCATTLPAATLLSSIAHLYTYVVHGKAFTLSSSSLS
jgi:hypothetical protein